MATAQQAKDALDTACLLQQDIHDLDLITVAEVAHIFRVDETTVRRWIRQGTLEAVALPSTGRYHIKRETLERLLGQPVGA